MSEFLLHLPSPCWHCVRQFFGRSAFTNQVTWWGGHAEDTALQTWPARPELLGGRYPDFLCFMLPHRCVHRRPLILSTHRIGSSGIFKYCLPWDTSRWGIPAPCHFIRPGFGPCNPQLSNPSAFSLLWVSRSTLAPI